MSVIPAGALIRNREAPELGSGRVLAELEGGSVTVVFENSEEVREVRIAHTDIVRQPLIPGTRVGVQSATGVREAEIVQVHWPRTPQDLCEYVVRGQGVEETLLESQVSPLPPATNSPMDELGALHWRGPFRFFSRWDMNRMISGWYEDSEGLPSAIGARIEPKLHTVHAMRRALWAPTRRWFLADEDPHARLYAAGMIYQRMCAADPQLRVLIIAPGRRTHRWQTEMELRFGGREFVRIDLTHLANNPAQRWESVSQNQRLIVSMSRFRQFPQACGELILGDVWDLIVVDEIHRLRVDNPVYEWLQEASARVENLLVLGALPERAVAAQWEPILGILRAQEDDELGVQAPDAAAVEARMAEVSAVWALAQRAEQARQRALDEDALDEDEAQVVAELAEELLGADEFVMQQVDGVRDADVDALTELVGYLRRYYRLEPQVVRSRRAHLASYEVEWGARSAETLTYEPDSAEAGLIAHLAALSPAGATDPLQMALHRLYQQAAAGTPERFFSLLEQRLDALDTTAGKAGGELAVLDLLDADMGPREEQWFAEQVIAAAPALDDEIVWIVDAMSHVGQWHAEAAAGCARFHAAADWVRARLQAGGVAGDEDAGKRRAQSAPRIVVACDDGQTVRDAAAFLEAEFGPDAVEMLHAAMPFDEQNEAVERFGRDRDCFLLVCDQTGSQGRDLSAATVVLHLTQPWSAQRAEWRIGQVDTPHREVEIPVHSVVLLGPSPIEQTLHALYASTINLYAQAPAALEYTLAEVDLGLSRAAGGDAEEFREQVEALAAQFDAARALSLQDQAYQNCFDPSDVQLAEDAEYCELLEFVDGIADSLPIRHWARMLGIQDHAAGPGAFDFKWHWSNVRRALPGYMVGPEDVDLLLPQEQVEMLSGTFSRKRALRSESLAFFGPGHRFVDALVEDAMRGNSLPTPGFAHPELIDSYEEPQDGRATIFARRLGPENRGKVFAHIIAAARLGRGAWEGMQMPQGLINRAYRHLWPESLSVPVEIDLRGQRPPSLVTNRDLLQKIDASYQGPEADQKLEYEIFIQAIEDVARFRDTLDQAVKLALAHIAADREGLVDGAAAELEDDVASEMAFLRAQCTHPDPERAARAAHQLDLYERLIESVRGERLEVDAIAIVVGGTPQVLIR